MSVDVPEVPKIPEFAVQTSSVSIFNQVLPATMYNKQTEDPVLELVQQYALKGENLKGSAIVKIVSKAVNRYLPQFERLTMKQGVLH